MPQDLCIVWKLEYILWEWRNGLTCNIKVYCIEQMTIEPLNIKRIKFQNLNVSRLVLQLSLPYPLEPGFKSRMNSACRCCSNYIWVINNFVAYEGAFYIRDLMVFCFNDWRPSAKQYGMSVTWNFQPPRFWFGVSQLFHKKLMRNSKLCWW